MKSECMLQEAGTDLPAIEEHIGFMTDAGEALLQNSLVLYDEYPESELWELDVFHDDRWQQIQQEFSQAATAAQPLVSEAAEQAEAIALQLAQPSASGRTATAATPADVQGRDEQLTQAAFVQQPAWQHFQGWQQQRLEQCLAEQQQHFRIEQQQYQQRTEALLLQQQQFNSSSSSSSINTLLQQQQQQFNTLLQHITGQTCQQHPQTLQLGQQLLRGSNSCHHCLSCHQWPRSVSNSSSSNLSRESRVQQPPARGSASKKVHYSGGSCEARDCCPSRR